MDQSVSLSYVMKLLVLVEGHFPPYKAYEIFLRTKGFLVIFKGFW